MVDDGNDDGLDSFLRGQQQDLAARKSIKVKLPIRQHIKLHAMKLFTENNISETVELAVDAYLEEQEDESPEASAASEMVDEVTDA